jgi:hypothetical protein
VCLAVITYEMWWHPKALVDLEPFPLAFLVTVFWITLAVAIATVPLLRKCPWLAGSALAATFAILAIASNPVVVVSWWLVRGELRWR